MTAVNAIAQWLLGGGGTVLKFVLYVFVAWLLIGALPKMRRDAAAKVPQVRGVARDRMRQHALEAKAAGRGKGAEWWAWTAAWGTVATAQEGARFGKYMVVSAWHGWGDHKRRVQALREGRPWRRNAPPASPDAPPPAPPAPPPPDGGTPGTAPPATAPGGTGHAGQPPQPAATVPPRPSPPWQPGPPGGPGWKEDRPPAGAPGTDRKPLSPAPAGDPRNDGAAVIPIPLPGKSPATGNEGGKPMAAEINNLEAAVQVVAEMQQQAQRSLDDALLEKSRAEKALANAEQASADLAAAGIRGPVMDAFVRYHEAMELAKKSADAEVGAYEQALAAADAARGALQRHQDAADQLAATGGAADRTAWYGKTG